MDLTTPSINERPLDQSVNTPPSNNENLLTLLVQECSRFNDQTAFAHLDTSLDPLTGKPKHDYYVDGTLVTKDQGWVGTTTYIHSTLFSYFDVDVAMDAVLNGRRYSTDPTYRYYQLSPQLI